MDFIHTASDAVASIPPATMTLAVTLVSIFIGSLAAGLAGFAFSAIAGAILFHWQAPIEAVPLMLICSITTQLFSISNLWNKMQWRLSLPYLAGGIAGIPVGAKLLEDFSPHAFAAGFGVFLSCYSTYMLLRPDIAFRGGGRIAEVAAGFAGGITGGATGMPWRVSHHLVQPERPHQDPAARHCAALHFVHADRDAGLFLQARHPRLGHLGHVPVVRAGGHCRHLARPLAVRARRRWEVPPACPAVPADLRRHINYLTEVTCFTDERMMRP